MKDFGTEKIGFVLIGGQHQLLHIVPVAAALSRERRVTVVLFAATDVIARDAAALMRRLDCGPFELSVLRLPDWLERVTQRRSIPGSMKVPRLLFNVSSLRDCTALVTAERTSSALRRLPGRSPLMIHIRHGAGDRAVGFERRIKLFDHLLVAGEKDRRRVVEEKLLPPSRCHAVGYIKLSALRQLHTRAPVFFDNGRPTVLYNPHFETALSSWPVHARGLIDAIAQSGRFNLIVAPHVKLFASQDPAARREWENLAVPGRVIVDLGSARSSDMSYTLGADIYLGDVSSQIYEFLADPRPCVFVDSHRVDWRGDANYRMWAMGEVVQHPAAVVDALLRAPQLHGERYRAIQQQIVTDTLGESGPGCTERAAQVILDSLGERIGPRIRSVPDQSGRQAREDGSDMPLPAEFARRAGGGGVRQ